MVSSTCESKTTMSKKWNASMIKVTYTLVEMHLVLSLLVPAFKFVAFQFPNLSYKIGNLLKTKGLPMPKKVIAKYFLQFSLLVKISSRQKKFL